ncbi:MAG TPA: SPW repeat protein [Candidatus Limnocylindrales bacterium]|nr:SPW repeat protein [Candidatus Limnocylindrales bacterium]
MRTTTNDQVTWASGLSVLAGLWLLISPWVLGFSDRQNPLWNAVILGIVIAVLAFIRAGGWYSAIWLAWVNLVLGIWVFISPWVLGFADQNAPLWDALVVGVIIVILSAWSIWATSARGAPNAPAV